MGGTGLQHSFPERPNLVLDLGHCYVDVNLHLVLRHTLVAAFEGLTVEDVIVSAKHHTIDWDGMVAVQRLEGSLKVAELCAGMLSQSR